MSVKKLRDVKMEIEMTVAEQIKEYVNIKSKSEKAVEQLQNKLENNKLKKGLNAYEFAKRHIEPQEKEIENLKKQLKKMEYDFDNDNVQVNIGDLMDEIAKISKIRTKDLDIFINDIVYSWGKDSVQNIEKYVNAGEFTPMLNICICHKLYAGYRDGSSDCTQSSIYYDKDIELNSRNITFKKGTLKDNVNLTTSPYGIRFKNLRDLNIRMTLKELVVESDTWTPVDTMKKAVLNCLKKAKENTNLPNIGD